MDHPGWLPAIISINDFAGAWPAYLDAVYSQFELDFLTTQPKFNGCWVRCRHDPIIDGKEAGFWHCTSEGKDETNRTADTSRMARVAWIRAIIENAADPMVSCWQNNRDGSTDNRQLLWFNEEFLVVLGERIRPRDGFRYWQLITAYPTPEEHRRKKLRRERDEWLQKQLTPPPC